MKKTTNILCIIITLISLQSFSQNEVIFLWDIVPNQRASNEKEIVKTGNIVSIRNVQNPSFEVFLAPKQLSNGKAVLIFPGGGYGNLGIHYEGSAFAKWLNSKGISAFVLKYRLPNSKTLIKPHLAPLQDAQRAMRTIRYNAQKWGVKANDIGILGFSAGGHLASTLGTHFEYNCYQPQNEIDKISARPDFMALIYPVISMKDSITHKGSKLNLLGKNPKDDLVHLFSNESQVTPKTPPTFILHCTDDRVVPIENSLDFFKSLTKNAVPTEIHIYPKGGHGFAFATNDQHLKNWTSILHKWLINPK